MDKVLSDAESRATKKWYRTCPIGLTSFGYTHIPTFHGEKEWVPVDCTGMNYIGYGRDWDRGWRIWIQVEGGNIIPGEKKGAER